MHRILSVLLAVFVASGYAAQSLCPSPEQIEPCTCFKDERTDRLTALCQNFTTASEVGDIFSKNPNWNVQDVQIAGCIMSYIPASVLEQGLFQNLNVSDSVLDTLFDVAPKKTQELNLNLYSLRLLRGFEWKLFSNSSLKEFGAHDTHINSFGSSFKDNMPRDVKKIWFIGTNTRRIASRAFENLKKLQVLGIRESLLKVLSRNMFPKPWNSIVYLDFSYNKIMSLPEDIFVDMPNMSMFILERNLLTTMSEKVFIRRGLYALKDNPFNCNCNMKWITTTKIITQSSIIGKCAQPRNVKGRELEKLTKNDFLYCH